MKTLILFIAIVLLPLITSQTISELFDYTSTELISPTPTVPTEPNYDVPTTSSTSTRLSATFKQMTSITPTRLSATFKQMTSITPTPNNDPDNRNAFLTYLKYIYIIAGVILFLVLIIILLLAAMCVLCQRRYSEEKEQKRKKKKKGVKPSASPSILPTIHVQAAPLSQPSSVSTSLQSTPVHIQTPLIANSSPKRKTDNVKGGNHGHKKTPDESGSMTDFPLLCRVLQDYDSAHHTARIMRASSNELESSSKSNDSGIYHMRFPSGTSSDLEASIGKSTTTSYISNDYDELDNVFELLKMEGASPHKIPPKTLPKPSRAMTAPRKKLGSVEETTEPIDAYGYHMINIRKLGSLDRSDSMKRSQSANGIFDDPKYDKLPLDSPLDVQPPHLVQSMLTKSDNPKDIDPRSALLLYKPRQFQEYPPTNEKKSSSMKRSYSTSATLDTTAFDKRDYKEYMSLQQLLDLVNTKLTPSRETSADIEEEEEELYCPRVVRPAAMEMT